MRADVVIIGAGMAGAHLAYSLVQQGVDVLMLEAGPRRPRSAHVKHFYENPVKGPQAAYPSAPSAPHPEDGGYDDFYVQKGSISFIGAYLRLFGGTTWHWTGFADRLRPNDFRMRSRFGVADDWPLGYEDLLPYYVQAERRWGVAGDPDHVWGAPREEPYPLPPVPMSYMDQQVIKALDQLGLHAGPFSHARNSVEFDGRPPCCGNNTCVPICPIGAKYDASMHAEKAEALGARVECDALVTFMELDEAQQVRRVKVRRPDGENFWVEGRIFALCGHAIENPRLLLNSAQEAAPQGVANSSGVVGRYLLTQANQDTWGLTKEPVFPYRGPQQTAGLIELRDGDFRGEKAAIGTSFMNSGWSGNSDATELAKKLIGEGKRGPELARAVAEQVSRHLRLNSSAEILPDPDNRVELAEERDSAGVPKPQVTVHMDDYTRRGLEEAEELNRRIFEALGATEVQSNEPYLSNAIIGGTTRMGEDPTRSVVGTQMVAHDHTNLFILGTSTHITAPVNAPTLTVAALAIRAAEEVQRRL
ncbi:GMC family oxidoreductase [Aquibaculum sediminis]|uniref:GMC family oxidoreductase n=1 Tax=Aquibaculum sediminis TaxID=3231907 RepID=UPI003454D605